ncbi:glycosyltransferase family 4 protein [Paenibacillus sp. KQZ6P-2]|uniref:Glycosyltransferase family 4 protein n=1 Tax=Paenibacillus mangrovi TaxID=2931978 RepID=A0A9X2B7Z1_9BACL|nr:glycosyltransferase family 4 protein [Paenibacillus mangrovi]MCJ8013893.1 glycosyltransferase family 4 protein [Paenibacillus mangrovi]
MTTYKPKLMLFSHVSNTDSITGAEKLLLFFCLQIAPYFNCILIAPQEGKLTAYARKQGILVRIQPYPLIHRLYFPGERLEQEVEELRNHPYYPSVVRCIKETAPDIVLTNTLVNVLPAIAAKSLGIPVLWKINEIMQENVHRAAAIAIVEKYSDCLIAISETAARVFRGNVSRPIILLPPSSDDKLLRPSRSHTRTKYRNILHINNSQLCVGYISSFIHPPKGLLEFIRMALTLSESNTDCQFVVIGKPADQMYYERCIAEVNASNHGTRFRFIPFVESVHLAYSAMDILIVPSMVQEGFGMTALEGMLCGKPVVAFDAGGLGELMRNTGNGHFIVPTGDYTALAAKVAELLNDPLHMQNIGNRNAAAARAQYGLNVYRQKVQAFVHELQQGCPDWMSGSISRSVKAYRDSRKKRRKRSTKGRIGPMGRKGCKGRMGRMSRMSRRKAAAIAVRRYHRKRRTRAGRRMKRRIKLLRRR